jgi:hypothetical protein
MPVIWERSGGAFYASVAGLGGGIPIRLIVEFDRDHWDWMVWRADEDRDKARQGLAGTVQEAMRDAEKAAG